MEYRPNSSYGSRFRNLSLREAVGQNHVAALGHRRTLLDAIAALRNDAKWAACKTCRKQPLQNKWIAAICKMGGNRPIINRA